MKKINLSAFLKQHITLIAGISIPILMIIFVAASIYLPALFIKPQYNFVYTIDSYYNSARYVVINNRLTSEANSDYYSRSEQGPSKLYLYDVKSDKSQEISYDTASSFSLSSNTESLDGFSVVNGESSGGFFPFYYSSSGHDNFYIKNGNSSKKLNDIKLNESSYYNFRFLGWVNK
ncbi:MAG: hypothetical protein WA087_00295 [Candidatus Saccharimonadales bacterium]